MITAFQRRQSASTEMLIAAENLANEPRVPQVRPTACSVRPLCSRPCDTGRAGLNNAASRSVITPCKVTASSLTTITARRVPLSVVASAIHRSCPMPQSGDSPDKVISPSRPRVSTPEPLPTACSSCPPGWPFQLTCAYAPSTGRYVRSRFWSGRYVWAAATTSPVVASSRTSVGISALSARERNGCLGAGHRSSHTSVRSGMSSSIGVPGPIGNHHGATARSCPDGPGSSQESWPSVAVLGCWVIVPAGRWSLESG